MIRIQLPEGEARRLEELFRSTDDRKLRDRLQIVLLAHKGRPRQQIASDLAIHRRSVTRWLNAYCDGGPDALAVRKGFFGRRRHLVPAEAIEQIDAMSGVIGLRVPRENVRSFL